MAQDGSRRLLYWHWVIGRSARSLGAPADLVSVGWVSALARGVPDGARAAQVAYQAATRR